MAKLLDANVVIRYLIGDDTKKALRFEKLLTSGKQQLILADVIVAEIVWTLESHFRVKRTVIAEKLSPLLMIPSIFTNRTLLSKALELYRLYSIDYIDAYLIAYQRENHIDAILSYDRDINKVKGAAREEP